ncbi:MAG: chemotaxis protein CheW [Acidobacteriota bacterium]
MMFLILTAGADSYALAASQVTEVVPMARLRSCPGAPDYVAGLLNFRGLAVPVIDMCRLAAGKASAERLSTRIILTPYRRRNGLQRLIGIMAEGVTDAVDMKPEEFASSGVHADGSEYLGEIACGPRGMVQRVEVERLLPVDVDGLLFDEGTDAGS